MGLGELKSIGEFARSHMINAARSTFLGLSVVLGLSLALPLPGADGRIAHLPSICPFHSLTGLPCPGCGLTRAFVCLGHGQFSQSLHWHPIGWLIYGVFVALWARAGLIWATQRTVFEISPRTSRLLTWSGTAILMVVGAVRLAWAVAHPGLRIPY